MMKVSGPALLAASASVGLVRQQTPKVSAEDLRRLTGARRAGSLTYLDYRSNRQVTTPSNLNVTQAAGDETSRVFEYEYPDEPKANGRRALRLSDDGAVFGGGTVVERASLDGGGFRLVTVKRGKDDEKQALFRLNYTLEGSAFTIKKGVRAEGAAEFFERNRYRWKR